MDLNFWFLLAAWHLLRHFKESRYVCPPTSYLITSFYVQRHCLDNINLYKITPHRPHGVGALWVRGLTKHSKILEFIGFFQNVFCFSDRSSILRDLGVTLIGEP